MGKEKIVAIMSGGDWMDASVEHLIIPNTLNLEEQKHLYDDWYKKIYCQNLKTTTYISFIDFLINKGARKTTSKELEEFWD